MNQVVAEDNEEEHGRDVMSVECGGGVQERQLRPPFGLPEI